jgi:type III secretion protein T
MDLLNHIPLFLGSTADYVSFVQSLPHFDEPITILSTFLLALMRIAPIVSVVPFLGSKLPGPAKMGFVIAIALLFLPHILMMSKQNIAYDITFVGLALKEILIGVIIGFLASIPFHIATSSGILVDFLRGSSALQVGDPTMQTQSSSIGVLYNQILIVFFFQVEGPFLFLDTLLQSYNFVPIDQFLPASFFNIHLPFWNLVMELLTKVTAFSIQFAAPPILAILMAEMFLGIANRLAVNVQIAFLGMALKSLFGLALLWAGWSFIIQQMVKGSLVWFHNLTKILSTF